MGFLPLPKSRDGKNRNFPNSKDGNAGLAFSKFVDAWPHAIAENKFELGAQEKLAFIKKFTVAPHGKQPELTRANNAIASLAIAQSKASALLPLKLETVSPFVTGLGYDHATENGFVWHHTLGVPYLPSSGIKGMMRAFADHWQALGEEGDPDSGRWFERIVELFGNYPAKAKGDEDRGIEPQLREPRMGRLIVFDALPVAPVQLMAEVMTPHDGGWRLKGATTSNGVTLSPGDWHNPIPIPFLAVKQGAKFQFALGLAQCGKPADLAEGYFLLEAALQWMGIGAKTASGFGRFMSEIALETQKQSDTSRAEKAKEEAVAQKEREAAAAKAAIAAWVPSVGEIVRQKEFARPDEKFMEIVKVELPDDFWLRKQGGSSEILAGRSEFVFAAIDWPSLKR